MNNSDLISKYLNKIITLIISSEDCIRLISPKLDSHYEVEDILLGGEYDISRNNAKVHEILQPYIYDSFFVPDILTDDRVIICTDSNIEKISNSVLTNFVLHIWVYVPQEKNRLTEHSSPTKNETLNMGYFGNRTMSLCSAIENLLIDNSIRFGIGKITPCKSNYNTISIPIKGYYGRQLRFDIYGFADKEVLPDE